MNRSEASSASGAERSWRASRDRWPNSTVLYITHDIAEASAFDRVLVVDRGRII